MRRKSEAKRDAILDVAAGLFREVGFERASMAEISARVGGSKATLYSYFDSKEALFFEVLFRPVQPEFQLAHQALSAGGEGLEKALQRFGERLLALLYSPDVQAARRLVIAEAGRSDLGRLCYARGPAKGHARVAEFLREAMEAGRLRRADPNVVAHHFLALLEAELLPGFLFQTLESVDAADIRAVAGRAVAAFLGAYGSGAQAALP
ncbi:TetR/AcrR family transcriptional regulator [Ralstonia solanacearum]|uniref:TetR/AcrR family transcriptional regulator n=2 Tax=Ralstonia solanacearum TaxID=305 RepID=A0AAW5ZTR8_RALSL|nr:TetR/AcrR family transcriptional regulator [Ralstonia solanacearum]AYB58145.2 TetR/AcrR family transcriptional regulator [Ralstonia solanacearum]MBB6593520.1 TetR/AcrR family transcriptional regulator [Ralstonia solanacearum]MBB6597747.1 TetR/AcrR family transcriptional regulator [Ralstonia solanacearum]MDB0544036.1 TetR/AcrR family transcriptional regulator [Ralstonia solanacearum]MDB0553821.1 TetR/AcrR family transcriptional regulator [Ralstonia solanacearum]